MLHGYNLGQCKLSITSVKKNNSYVSWQALCVINPGWLISETKPQAKLTLLKSGIRPKRKKNQATMNGKDSHVNWNFCHLRLLLDINETCAHYAGLFTSLSLSGRKLVSTSGFFPSFFFFTGMPSKHSLSQCFTPIQNLH